MKKRIWLLLLTVILAVSAMTGCSGLNSMKDGYFTAEMSEYTNGWKEYLRIQVKHGVIVAAEFNAKNQSGFIKAWDNTYMKNMNEAHGTYPNKYTREYVQQIIDGQAGVQVDAISGASTSGAHFEKLVQAVLKSAKKGNSKTVVVEE